MTSAFWTQLAEEQTILTAEEKTSRRYSTSIIALKSVSIQWFLILGHRVDLHARLKPMAIKFVASIAQ